MILWESLERNAPWICFGFVLQDVFKMSSRSLAFVLQDGKLSYLSRLQDAFKTCFEDVFKIS